MIAKKLSDFVEILQSIMPNYSFLRVTDFVEILLEDTLIVIGKKLSDFVEILQRGFDLLNSSICDSSPMAQDVRGGTQ